MPRGSKGTAMARTKPLRSVPEKVVGEIAEVLELTDPQKTTRNAAVLGLAGGAVAAALLAQAAGVVELFNPVLTFLLFAFAVAGLPFAWQLKGVDVWLAVRFFALHRRVHLRRGAKGEGLGAPEYFRLKGDTEVRPWATAKMAFEPYSLSLSIGAMAWSATVPHPASAPATPDASAALALSVAAISMSATLLATWIVPPLWLLRTAGARMVNRKEGRVSRVDEWYNAVFGPVMGVAALGTLFIVYAIAGLGLRQAVFSFVTISVALFPIAFASTYLYRMNREGEASVIVTGELRDMGVAKYESLEEAVRGPVKEP